MPLCSGAAQLVLAQQAAQKPCKAARWASPPPCCWAFPQGKTSPHSNRIRVDEWRPHWQLTGIPCAAAKGGSMPKGPPQGVPVPFQGRERALGGGGQGLGLSSFFLFFFQRADPIFSLGSIMACNIYGTPSTTLCYLLAQKQITPLSVM